MTDYLVVDFKALQLSPNSTLLEAMKVLNSASEQIVLVVEDNKLIATITDGDIRRGLLRGVQLSDSIKPIMNQEFKFVNEENSMPIEITPEMQGIKYLPVVNGMGGLKSLLRLNNSLSQSKKLKNAVVIMAGGKGTRLRPLTQNCPKPMLHVQGKPMLEHILDKCMASGFSRFYISVNYLKEQIISYFGDGSSRGISIHYLEEDEPLGTAGSLSLLPHNLDEPFLVLNGDVITNFDPCTLLQFHLEHKAEATLCVRENSYTLPYGVVKVNDIELAGFQEKPTLSYFANAGVYIIQPSLLKYIQNSQFIDMPTLINNAQENGSFVAVCPIHEFWIDVGRPETLKEANQYMELQ